ncbi:pentapeptide repeat-containing protein [Arenicellales bacterium nBUS_45]
MKKLLPLILPTLLLTSCSGPDSSGGIEFSKTANAFPFGDCRGSGYQTHHTEKTGCGWFSAHEKSYYIMPYADLSGADLNGADLSYADLNRADLSYADLNGADLSYANLYGAYLNANLRHAILNFADLSYATLAHANLRRARLIGTNLSGANLYGADLTASNHTGARGNSRTICPNGKSRRPLGSLGHGDDCGF